VVEVWLPLEAGDGGSKSTRRMGRVADVAGQAPD
jgi:hypothetical protein